MTRNSCRPPGATDARRSASSRAELLRRAALIGGSALATGGVVTALAEGGGEHAPQARDVQILNYVLRLERLKAAFYKAAAEGDALTGELKQLAQVLGDHERAHVAFLRRQLGTKATPAATYDFGDAVRDADRFASTAHELEETAVSAYIGEGANLSRPFMVPFAQLCSVEARHAAWTANVLGRDPAPRAADKSKAPKRVLEVVEMFEAGS